MWAKANGAPTILRPRLRRATAPLAGRWHRHRDFIWCGWSIEFSLSPHAGRGRRRLPKILIDHPPVDRSQRDEIGDRRAFIDLMHGLADQTEFQNRAIILDETRIGGAAGG